MKRSFVLVSILLLLISVFPAAAQDAASSPPACTSEQVSGVVKGVASLGSKIKTASDTGTNAQSAEELTAALLAWGDVYRTFFAETYGALPDCIDGELMRANMGVLFELQMTLEATALLNKLQTDAGDLTAAVNTAQVDLVTKLSGVAQTTTSSFSSYLQQLQGGTGAPSWLPTCTEDQLKFTTELEGFEKDYGDQAEALQAYIDTRNVDEASYVALASAYNTLSNALSDGSGSCDPLFQRMLANVYVIGDTYLALTIGKAASYLQDGNSAEAINSLCDYFDGTLSIYLAPPTEEAAS